MKKISKECPICLEDIDNDNIKTIITFDCLHEVHLYCINEWKYNKCDNSEVFKCLLCNENKNIINIRNPEVHTYNTEISTGPVTPIRNEVNNNCCGIFTPLNNFLERILNL